MEMIRTCCNESIKVKVELVVLCHDLKLTLTTFNYYPADHWKWPHSSKLSFQYLRPQGRTVNLHFLSAINYYWVDSGICEGQGFSEDCQEKKLNKHVTSKLDFLFKVFLSVHCRELYDIIVHE